MKQTLAQISRALDAYQPRKGDKFPWNDPRVGEFRSNWHAASDVHVFAVYNGRTWVTERTFQAQLVWEQAAKPKVPIIYNF